MKSNVSMSERQDFFPESQRTLSHRRRLVISVYATYVLGMFTGWFLLEAQWGGREASPLERLLGHLLGDVNSTLFFVPFIILFVCATCSILLFASIRDIIQAKDKVLDERQLMVRDRAYRYAYRVVSMLFLLLGLYITFLPSFVELGVYFLIPSNPAQTAFMSLGIVLIVWGLPTSIIAWTEREI